MKDNEALAAIERCKMMTLDYNLKCALSRVLDWRAEITYYKSQIRSMNEELKLERAKIKDLENNLKEALKNASLNCADCFSREF